MPVISVSNAPKFELPNVTFTGLASPQRGSKENSVWRFTIAPKAPGLPHQLTREEIIIALSGSAIAEIGKLDGQQKRLPGRIVKFAHYDPEKLRPRS